MILLLHFTKPGPEFWGKSTMKIYAVKEVDYERVKIKKAKTANRLAKR